MSPEQAEHHKWMTYALELAKEAERLGEVPVGAVIVLDGELVGEGYNQPISANDPSSHAEIVAIRKAAANLSNYRLPNCRLYVTIEPCSMCAGAIIHSRIKTVVFGALEPRGGAVVSHLNLFDAEHLNHRVDFLGGVLEEECGNLLSDFFRRKRRKVK